MIILFRCLAPFTLTRRKHHCRNCGEVLCGKCCGKKIRLGSKKRRVRNYYFIYFIYFNFLIKFISLFY